MTREAMNKLPQHIQAQIEAYRSQYKTAKEDYLSGMRTNVEAARCASSAYMRGLKDAGLITEMERRALFLYTTV